MSIVIAYQSLNANSSSEHGLTAANSQHFTRMAHNNLSAQNKPWMLSQPTSSSVAPDVPIHGPAELLQSAPSGYMGKGQHDNATFLSMVESKARQTYQNLIRAFGRCDLLVYGELDSSHPDWASMAQNAGSLLHSTSPTKACNCFSVHSTNPSAGKKLASGDGWLAIKCYSVVAVFVHVPNAIAKNASSAVDFYQKIHTAVSQAGEGAIDVIMGDTNQSSSDFTRQAVNKAFNASFANAHPDSTIDPFDSYQRTFGGTNSTGTKPYDVAVYNTATIHSAKVTYLSQATPTEDRNAAAVTDHMGIGLHIEK